MNRDERSLHNPGETFSAEESSHDRDHAHDLLQFVREMLYVQGYEARRYCRLKGRTGLRSDCLVCDFVTLVPYPPFVMCGYGIEEEDDGDGRSEQLSDY